MIKLSFPFTEEKIRALKVGDEVLISGVVFSGRDAVHKYLHEGGQLPPGVIIRDFGVRGVIGKGGMGDKTLAACHDYGCVYLHGVGGAAQVLAERIKKVRNVYLLEKFGSPEAIWELE